MEDLYVYGCTAFLGICAVFDYRTKTIPVKGAQVTAAAGVLLRMAEGTLFTWPVCGGILLGVFFWMLSKATAQQIGEGDGIMLAVTGLYTGFWQTAELLLGALLLAAGVSVWLLLRKKATWRTELPFAPFLFGAYCILQLSNTAGV